MGAMDLLKSEFRKLTENKALLLAVIGVLLIPIIYVAILLSAKWGPYDNMDNLPVAVVNNDAGATSDGKPINVGNDLVATLEASKTLGWKFITTEEAEKGLKNNDYYMVITIPEDFSQKVTTVLDDNPQVPEIIYTKNEGMNFMAAQVTNSAVERVREQLGDKITATFATTVFNRFPDIAEGFTAGAEGSQQIFEGTVKLQDGTQQIISNMEVKKPDIARLAAGAKEADEGVSTLLSSVVGGTPDIQRLNNGAGQIANGSGELANGADALAAGANTLADGTGQLADGSKRLVDGTKQLSTGTKDLANGAGSLATGATQVNDGASALATGTTALASGATSLNDGANKVLDGLKSADSGADLVLDGLKKAQAGSEQLSTVLPQVKDGAGRIETGLTNINTQASALIAEIGPTLVQASPESAAKLNALINGLKQLEAGAKEVNMYLGLAAPGSVTLNDGLKTLVAGQTQLTSGLSQLIDGQTQVVAGAGALETGAKQVNAGAGSLAAGAKQLNTGAGALAAGAKQVNAGVGSLASGANDLAVGISRVDAGAGELASGANRLSAGADTLSNGAGELSAGTGRLVNSWGTLSSGVQRLKAGTSQIADGNQTVATGWGTIIDGVTQVDDGVGQLNAGSKELQTGLAGGAEEVSAVSPKEENINMFATPVNVVGENANAYEYYRDSTAPYILSLALFVSTLILSFFTDFKQPVADPRSAFSWYFSKWLKLAIFAVSQAIILSLFVLLILGLGVSSVPLFILFTIFVSLTFMSIVFFLVAVGGNIGRFVGLAFIVLQLSITGSNLPIDMLPQFHRNLSSVLPLTYSNAGFKSIISLGDTNMLVANAGVLAIYFVGASLLALVAFVIGFKSGKSQSLASEPQVNN